MAIRSTTTEIPRVFCTQKVNDKLNTKHQKTFVTGEWFQYSILQSVKPHMKKWNTNKISTATEGNLCGMHMCVSVFGTSRELLTLRMWVRYHEIIAQQVNNRKKKKSPTRLKHW